MENPLSKFSFQPHEEPVNWRNIAHYDIDQIKRNKDITSLQDAVINVALHKANEDGWSYVFSQIYGLDIRRQPEGDVLKLIHGISCF
jgi:hypothetical protein